jgi:DNA-binding response OmpR family regulator
MRKKLNVSSENNGISILALDDDPVMTLTLQAYFQNAGYSVDTSNDPEAAVELIRRGTTTYCCWIF